MACMYFDTELGQTDRGETKDSILRVPGKIVAGEDPWSVLVHGDCWSNNMMFRYDDKTGKPIEIRFIDFQLSRETDNSGDVAYSLYTSGSLEFRRKHLNDILKLYFDTFTKTCDKFCVPYLPGWSWDELQRRFRRASILGATAALSLHLMLTNPEEFENLDDVMAKVEVKGNSTSENMTDFILQMVQDANNKLHPSVTPRMMEIFHELIDNGVI